MTDLTAPSEGSASSAKEIADELCNILSALEHIDYNALSVEELSEVLEMQESIQELCLRYRRRQDGRTSPGGESGDR